MNTIPYLEPSEYILLVDDELDNLTVLSALLAQQGYTVRRVLNGQKALNLLRSKEPPALVMLDIMMPEMDGYELCKQIKTDEKTQDISVIFLSALDEVKNKVKGFEVGGSDYITKPFESLEVMARVENQLGLRKLKQHIKLEAQLRQSLIKEKELTELKRRIITTISHEYRTPLSVILSSAELLEHYCDSENEKQQKHIKRIQQMVQHLSSLVNDVALINEFEQDQVILKPITLNLIEFGKILISEIKLVRKVKQKINFSYQGDEFLAKWDERILRQMLSHLLSNAIKFSPADSEIDLKLIQQQDTIQFQVQDRGIGILAENQEKIFDPFYRGDNIGTIQGEGVGLAIVKKCVNLYGGQIQLKTELNKGTIFIITLPIPKN
ncbi:hybrid sensor histidine kinase/response regulator [Limnoraphis robusta Tam1]|uniref:hybrid sensor histidine kinase/response regulator n=1 Tax=Limnoraphis robusta TaxID=1118279 RepID=UPI002B21D592|nr:hybrid sensor histidine kinase/response regulator [Limnoraphis robusta]MEA5499104.1 hybrid sensor histidine kinase/response regulator [Limnoraphis robusta BA-68 BA1]MEA5542157.1 hybrid sensor histidine kinase/response regulator [Limnoraphis robusta Tam1]